MSFMDGFSGYNQIKMYPDDEKHTSFMTPLGVYCYTVMPLGMYDDEKHTSEDGIWYHVGASIEDDPIKFFLGVASGKFLVFVVTSKRIHLDPEKVRVVKEMQPPKSLWELRGL